MLPSRQYCGIEFFFLRILWYCNITRRTTLGYFQKGNIVILIARCSILWYCLCYRQTHTLFVPSANQWREYLIAEFAFHSTDKATLNIFWNILPCGKRIHDLQIWIYPDSCQKWKLKTCLKIWFASFQPSNFERTLWVSKALRSRISTSGSQRFWKVKVKCNITKLRSIGNLQNKFVSTIKTIFGCKFAFIHLEYVKVDWG